MPIESATYLNDLNGSNPGGGDPRNEGDNHIRLVKSVLQATFPGLAGRAWRVQGKTSNYSLAVTDNMSVINVTATGVTVSTAAAAGTMGNGYTALILANGFDVTFDPTSSETVNGVASLTIRDGQAALVVCNGTLWYAVVFQLELKDTSFILVDSGDVSKRMRFELSGLTTATMRTLTVQDEDGTIALTSEFAYSNLAGSPGRLELPWGYIYGCEISNDAGDLTNDINFAPGYCRDLNNVGNILHPASMVKQLDGLTWGVGSNQPGRVGTLADGTWHCFLIRKVSTGAVDACFSADPLGSDIPAATFGVGDTRFRRVGSILRLSSVNLPFTQFGNRFLIDPVLDQTVADTTASAVTKTLTYVPTGVKMVVNIFGRTGGSVDFWALVSSLDQADVAPSTTLNNITGGGASGYATAFDLQIRTNTSAQIRVRKTSASAGASWNLCVAGWIDERL